MSFEQPSEKTITILESAKEKEQRLLTDALNSLIEIDQRVFREGLKQRLFNKDVLSLTGLWLGVFWVSFAMGFATCYWLRG